MDGVLKRLPARFRHPVPNEIGEAIKRFIEGPLRGSREERHRKGLAGFRRLGHSSLNQIRPPSSRTTGASFLFLPRLLAESTWKAANKTRDADGL